MLCCMYTVVGLGNPGSEYASTRHNAGRMVVEKLAAEFDASLKAKKKPDHQVGVIELEGERVRLVVPDTFMNASGKAVLPYAKSAASAKKLVVVYDDLDLPLGVVRVSFGSSSGGHNGIKSIERALKTKNFVKIRIGVAKVARGKAKKPDGEKAVLNHLLTHFSKSEEALLCGAVYERALLALTTLVETANPVLAMNAVNGLARAE